MLKNAFFNSILTHRGRDLNVYGIGPEAVRAGHLLQKKLIHIKG